MKRSRNLKKLMKLQMITLKNLNMKEKKKLQKNIIKLSLKIQFKSLKELLRPKKKWKQDLKMLKMRKMQ